MKVAFLVNVVNAETGQLDYQFVSQNVWTLERPTELKGCVEQQLKLLEESGVHGMRCVIQQVIIVPD